MADGAPTKSFRCCTHRGCPNYALPGKSYCAVHAADARTRTYSKAWQRLYNTKEWARLREWQLSTHPLCAECYARGQIKAGVVVDHITPHKGDTELFYDSGNLQTLCVTCHNAKTAREDGGYGRRREQTAEERAGFIRVE